MLTVEDFLSAYVFEWTLHRLDLTAHLGSASGPSVAALRHSRGLFEKLTGTVLPATLADQAALLIGTGRRAPTPVELAALGALATRLPHSVG